MTDNVQMLGNVALMERPKVAFLSSRRVAPAAVMRCYDWATGIRGGGRGATALPDGGGTPGGSAGRLAPPGDGGHAGRVTLPQRARRPLSQCAAKMAALHAVARERDVVKLKDRLFIRGTFSPNYAIMCHG